MFSEKQELAEQIYAALRNDPRTENAPVEVVDTNGILTLLGEVQTEKVKRAVEEVARSHAGVISVRNELSVAERGR